MKSTSALSEQVVGEQNKAAIIVAASALCAPVLSSVFRPGLAQYNQFTYQCVAPSHKPIVKFADSIHNLHDLRLEANERWRELPLFVHQMG